MKNTSQTRHVVALIAGFAVSAFLLAVCGPETPNRQLGATNAGGNGLAARRAFSLSIHNDSAALPANTDFPYQAAPALGLTMADFTGDTHPDLATVELDRVDSANAHYWVEIRLTEGGGQILKVTAPYGGLLVNPKDVTGDGNLDLVIRSAKTGALVAVFLNDSHGHFDRADNKGFAEVLNNEPSRSSLTRKPAYPGAIFACPESHVIESPKGWFVGFPGRKRLACPVEPRRHFPTSFFSQFEQSPTVSGVNLPKSSS